MTEDEFFLRQIRREATVFALHKYIVTTLPADLLSAILYRPIQTLELVEPFNWHTFETDPTKASAYNRVSRSWQELMLLRYPERDVQHIRLLFDGVIRDYGQRYPLYTHQLSLIVGDLQ